MNLQSHYWNTASPHRELMSKHYRFQAAVYDLTRWMFLFGRRQIVRDLQLQEGEVVIEVGCGTGTNFSLIREAIGEKGELIAIDCSEAMLQKARERVQASGWKNVRVLDQEYGATTVTRGEADAVLFSYSLSMIPSWESALNCARLDLHQHGRVAIVDFCTNQKDRISSLCAQWMSWNHVDVERDYRPVLARHFGKGIWIPHRILGNALGYFRYVGHCRTAPTSKRARVRPPSRRLF